MNTQIPKSTDSTKACWPNIHLVSVKTEQRLTEQKTDAIMLVHRYNILYTYI